MIEVMTEQELLVLEEEIAKLARMKTNALKNRRYELYDIYNAEYREKCKLLEKQQRALGIYKEEVEVVKKVESGLNQNKVKRSGAKSSVAKGGKKKK